eukprot:TRINITY_DN7765_c0_g1_i1.p1 TRINITY_DN7765_c0_g1~~TRINITY_DN7765_c0_g1_i1.p1  ORF type:complete len:376 (-),score=107.03 TRINITY_DN7765_c0_g1_i1:20-1147(-)
MEEMEWTSMTEEEFTERFWKAHNKKRDEGEENHWIAEGKRSEWGTYRDVDMEELMETKYMTDDPLNSELIWLNVSSPTRDQLIQLFQKFELHPSLFQRFLQSSGTETFRNFGDYHFVELRAIDGENWTSEDLVIRFIMFPSLVISIHHHQCLVFPQIIYGWKKGGRNLYSRGHAMKDSDWVLRAAFHVIAELLDEHMESISTEVRTLDELTLLFNPENQSELLRRVANCRRILTSISSQITRKRDFCAALSAVVDPNRLYYFDELLFRMEALDEKAQIHRELLSNAHETYMARASIETARISNEISAIILKFSALSSVLIPFIWLTGVMAINISFPGKGTPGDLEEDHSAFITLTCLMVGLAIISLSIFKLKKWI